MSETDVTTPAVPEAPAITPPPPAPPDPAKPSGCLSSLGWLAVAPVLATFSPTFYYKAGRRSTGQAVLFFFALMALITSLQTCSVLWSFLQVVGEIQNGYARGDVPEITISQGTAEVTGEQPWVWEDATATTFLGVDTTGEITDIDQRIYTQGFLLKRNTLVMLNQRGQYQEVRLRDLQQGLNLDDPFILNAETVTRYWLGFTAILTIVMFILLVVWNMIIRLAYIALIALVLWGISAIIRRGTGFGPVLATGLYALVPALLIVFLISRLNISFPGLTTFFLLVFWIAGLARTLIPAKPYSLASFSDYLISEHPLRGWRALIGIPLAINIVLEMIFQWRAYYVILPLAFLTFAALAIVSFLPWFTKPSGPLEPAQGTG